MYKCALVRHEPEDYQRWSKRYSAKRKALGEVRVSVWAPAERVEELKNFAAWLRHEERQRKGIEPESDPSARLEFPKFEISQRPRTWVWVRVGQHETLMHQVLKANDGKWNGQKKLWRVPLEVSNKLGLVHVNGPDK